MLENIKANLTDWSYHLIFAHIQCFMSKIFALVLVLRYDRRFMLRMLRMMMCTTLPTFMLLRSTLLQDAVGSIGCFTLTSRTGTLHMFGIAKMEFSVHLRYITSYNHLNSSSSSMAKSTWTL
jgi:hypothetical protein